VCSLIVSLSSKCLSMFLWYKVYILDSLTMSVDLNSEFHMKVEPVKCAIDHQATTCTWQSNRL